MASASCAPASPAWAESSSRRSASGLRVSAAAGDSGEDFTTAWERLNCPAGGGGTAGPGAGFRLNDGGETCGGGLAGTAAARNCSAGGVVKARGACCPALGGGEASAAAAVGGSDGRGPVFSRAALSCVCVSGRAGDRFCPRSARASGRAGCGASAAGWGGAESFASLVVAKFSFGGAAGVLAAGAGPATGAVSVTAGALAVGAGCGGETGAGGTAACTVLVAALPFACGG